MSATFRELFDEEDRQELLYAINTRRNEAKQRHTKAIRRTERAPNPVTLERLQNWIIQLDRIADKLTEESN